LQYFPALLEFCPDLARWHFLLSWHSTGCSFTPLLCDGHVQIGPSSDVLSLMFAIIYLLSLLWQVGQEKAKSFQHAGPSHCSFHHKACLSQITQKTESNKRRKTY
jgi:hypothetical protein